MSLFSCNTSLKDVAGFELENAKERKITDCVVKS